MKNSKLKTFLKEMFPILLLLLMLPLIGLSQELFPVTSDGLLGKVGSWASNLFNESFTKIIVGFLSGWLAKHGWGLAIKALAQRSAVVFKEVEEFSHEMEQLSLKVDGAIEADGKIKANSISDVLAQGNRVILEGKDVIVSIKPKP